ncbi:hypothetical protein ASPFODRAFT_320845 [Aspergillus luchuensis CBS 106.47]|uniref:Uncharacterized protein n=1 Tax=Aspergillus luchuensis (strain CBS 106.47) TaxID=1137211 RepID=A0A1M3T9P1_ASPLC|nr:hypothetical protein ASPFODRAFT_320845 [Aspergillus luchuensis CBS 106.47]
MRCFFFLNILFVYCDCHLACWLAFCFSHLCGCWTFRISSCPRPAGAGYFPALPVGECCPSLAGARCRLRNFPLTNPTLLTGWVLTFLLLFPFSSVIFFSFGPLSFPRSSFFGSILLLTYFLFFFSLFIFRTCALPSLPLVCVFCLFVLCLFILS